MRIKIYRITNILHIRIKPAFDIISSCVVEFAQDLYKWCKVFRNRLVYKNKKYP